MHVAAGQTHQRTCASGRDRHNPGRDWHPPQTHRRPVHVQAQQVTLKRTNSTGIDRAPKSSPRFGSPRPLDHGNPKAWQAAPSSAATSTPSNELLLDPKGRAAKRALRFSRLVELRGLYRNFVRAKTLLRLQTPVYTPPDLSPPPDPVSNSVEQQAVDQVAEDDRAAELELQEEERRREAVDIVAEMLLTAEQLKVGLRRVSQGLLDIFSPSSPVAAEEAEAKVREQAQQYVKQLKERVAQELSLLPFASELEAKAAIDTRNTRFYKANGLTSETGSGPSVSASTSASSSHGSGQPGGTGGSSLAAAVLLPTGQEAAQQLASSIERLGQAEKFVAARIKPALRKAGETQLLDLVKGSGVYLQGFWTRLNGGGPRLRDPPLSPDLPLPTSTSQGTELAISQLSLELDSLEGRLKEAARTRETKLRRARAPEGRATMPFKLKTMDEEVLALSRQLAVRTLQLEMEFAYAALEDEALDIVGYDVENLVTRQGSTAELRLLAAEFALLDEQLAVLADYLTPAGAAGTGSHGAPSPASGPEAGTGVGIVPVGVEELLIALASEIPDLRQRVGVVDQVVFGGQGFSFTKARLQVREALDKLREAVTFLTRGLKLLSSDISSAARIFVRAAIGGTLKPREVSALRRTARDILAFIPFTIILIIPITPLGHVLVFGFIQTYFPSFFPSCFTSRRQELMIRYEDLEMQLVMARTQAEAAEEDAELMRAAAAVAQLTSNRNTTGSRGGSIDGADAGNWQVGEASNSSVRGSSSAAAGGATGDNGRGARSGSTDQAVNEDEDAGPVTAQTAQVRALEEQVAAVLIDVTLGEDSGDESVKASKASAAGKPANGTWDNVLRSRRT